MAIKRPFHFKHVTEQYLREYLWGGMQCNSYTDVAPARPATPLFRAGQNFSMLDPCLLPYIAIYPLKVPLEPLKTSKAPQNRQKSRMSLQI